jgi:homoserine kinase
MIDSSAIDAEDEIEMYIKDSSAVEVRVPASTSNLGSGFDCFGLALKLYLTVGASLIPDSLDPCIIRSSGENHDSIPCNKDNLIYRAMLLAAEREGIELPPVQLNIHNDIPLGRGLGSSAAAIIAGISLFAALCNHKISDEAILRYATEFEGHADNIGAALYGNWVVTCIKNDRDVLLVKRPWPSDIRILVISPEIPLETKLARAALPKSLPRYDAVYNIQRAALFTAAIENGSYDLLWEAMQDRLHQPYRQDLIPGLAEALATPPMPGLLGLALSGAGPSVLALVNDQFKEVGEAVANAFHKHGIETMVRMLEVDTEGTKVDSSKKMV